MIGKIVYNLGYDCFLEEINENKSLLQGIKQKELIQDRFIPNRKTSTFNYNFEEDNYGNEND